MENLWLQFPRLPIRMVSPQEQGKSPALSDRSEESSPSSDKERLLPAVKPGQSRKIPRGPETLPALIPAEHTPEKACHRIPLRWGSGSRLHGHLRLGLHRLLLHWLAVRNCRRRRLLDLLGRTERTSDPVCKPAECTFLLDRSGLHGHLRLGRRHSRSRWTVHLA